MAAPVTIQDNDFVQNGKPLRILAGAIHYFRVVRPYWRDRLIKLKAMGLNAVETYVPWNLHEPRPGQFVFSGILDLEAYLKEAADLGLMAIVRPGPYICSEWDLGGLPAWLLADPTMKLRCSYPPYLHAVDRYFDELLARLTPLQASRGGPVVALQVENEYGSFGNDQLYLRHLADGLRRRGFDGLLFTADGLQDWMLHSGTLPDILKMANFGTGTSERFAKLRQYQPQGPLMCGEFWNGWFDQWGKKHHYRDPAEVAAVLDDILAQGASVSFYMFHGGTTFGFMAGANQFNNEPYDSDVTSYDYGAPLDEAGRPTPKFWACRQVIGKYAPLPDVPLPEPNPRKAFGCVTLDEHVPLLEAAPMLATAIQRVTPEPMEMLGQNYGFILYRTTFRGPRHDVPLYLRELHDRAHIFVDGQFLAALERNDRQGELKLSVGPGDHTLDLLVESMGRVNFGPFLHDRKGITEAVHLHVQHLYHWTIYPLPLDDLTGLRFRAGRALDGPAFCRGTFQVDTPADAFLALPGWTKGQAFLNGFNLGRYWSRGPQQTLYIPAPLLRQGPNELIILELFRPGDAVELRDQPDLG